MFASDGRSLDGGAIYHHHLSPVPNSAGKVTPVEGLPGQSSIGGYFFHPDLHCMVQAGGLSLDLHFPSTVV
jgi:hypothetical protein